MMFLQAAIPDVAPAGELAAATLETVIVAALALISLATWRRTREAHFGWWAAAFGLYAARMGAIMAFLGTLDRAWLFWHQVITGWIAALLLQAAFAFAGRARWAPWRWILVLFPPVWSYLAVNQLDSFTLAAVPAVLFISGASIGTGIVLMRGRTSGTSNAVTVLGWSFIVWGAHHLDYPILRARGAWLPWGYYLDIMFVLAVGAGILLLVNSELASRLQVRTTELERLSRAMVRQHEQERRRLSMALHDETAQVFAGVKLQLGVLREQVPPAATERLDRALTLLDDGIQGVRNVTHGLRPALLDDLGLLPALRSLVAEFAEQHAMRVELSAPDALPVMDEDAELAVFRALQESLSNASRHAPGAPVRVLLGARDGHVTLEVRDAGRGVAASDLRDAEASGRLGLVGMRERIAALGGSVEVRGAHAGGTVVSVAVPTGEDVR